ncbi:MAG TPA: nucleoside triphosphate pyrophosphatase [Burkholderiales bacterium]|jgi:7-methyl-GTP pyrophosphatase|nr:nucleoside triphosphate pyrophosphatase [Burkholderiales bacterium]
MTSPLRLVLASTSRYRRGLLERLGIPFTVADPGVAEERRPGEAPEAMARRLAEAKSLAVAGRFRGALIIGCDQVAVGNGELLGKPGTRENAVRQLRALSGREAVFYTAVCVHNTSDGTSRVRVVPSRVTFRELDDGTIDRYLAREQPYDCAGSAKAEGLGIALIAKMECEDPNALVGLPLIALVDLLHEQGLNVL